jgi:hypothetical protein
VDKVVQSDVTTATSDADVEKITNTSDTTKTTTNTETTNEDNKTITKTNEKSLKMETPGTASASSTSAQLIQTINNLNDENDFEGTRTTGYYITISTGASVSLPSSLPWGNYVRNITLDYQGQTITFNWGTNNLDIPQGCNLTLNNVKFQTSGPNFAINNNGNLTLNNSVISDSFAWDAP